MLTSMAMHWHDWSCSEPVGFTALKLMSRFGAVKAHQGVPACNVTAYDRTGLAYFDAGNACYKWVVMQCWPEAFSTLGISNAEKIGDCVEALLGFRWFLEHPDNAVNLEDNHRNDELLEVMNCLDQVVAYVYDHWEERYNLPWRFREQPRRR